MLKPEWCVLAHRFCPIPSRLPCHEINRFVCLSLSLPFFLGTGEEREELWRSSSRPYAQALCLAAPCEAPAHTDNCSADLWVAVPLSRWERCGSRSSGSPRFPSRGLAARPPRCQHGQRHKGPQQVSGAEKNVRCLPGSIVASFTKPLLSPCVTFTSISQNYRKTQISLQCFVSIH